MFLKAFIRCGASLVRPPEVGKLVCPEELSMAKSQGQSNFLESLSEKGDSNTREVVWYLQSDMGPSLGVRENRLSVLLWAEQTSGKRKCTQGL